MHLLAQVANRESKILKNINDLPWKLRNMKGTQIRYEFIGLVGRLFANGPGDVGSIPGIVIPKTLKIALDTSLLNTQHYKVRIRGKVV